MSYGFSVKNNLGHVIASTDGTTMQFYQKKVCDFVRYINHPVHSINPMENAYQDVAIYKAVFYVPYGTNPKVAMPFLKFNSNLTPAAVIETSIDSSNNVTIFVLQKNASAAPSIYLFTPAYCFTVSGEYGMVLRDSNNRITFDSGFLPLKVIGSGDGYFPSSCREAGNGSDYSPNLTPDTGNDVYHPVPTSTPVSDLLYYCPVAAYGAEIMTYEKSEEHCKGVDICGVCLGWESSYAEGNLWYAYYKGVLAPATDGVTKFIYIPYLYTHQQRSAKDSGWAILGVEDLWGGSIEVDSQAISIAFINTTRNTSQPYTILLTKASYYA
jgi:hypothetical protein